MVFACDYCHFLFCDTVQPEQCPDCGKKISLFGEGHLDEVAKEHGVEVLGRLPVDPKLAKACDAGAIELFEGDWLDSAADKIEQMK